MGTEDVNPGPHACIPSTLLTEQSLQSNIYKLEGRDIQNTRDLREDSKCEFSFPCYLTMSHHTSPLLHAQKSYPGEFFEVSVCSFIGVSLQEQV